MLDDGTGGYGSAALLSCRGKQGRSAQLVPERRRKGVGAELDARVFAVQNLGVFLQVIPGKKELPVKLKFEGQR